MEKNTVSFSVFLSVSPNKENTRKCQSWLENNQTIISTIHSLNTPACIISVRECCCLSSTDPFRYDQNSSLFCQYARGEMLRDIQGTSTGSGLVSPGAIGKHQL